jgi:hypothetical protein
MTKRIHESGTIVLDKATNSFRVCLITEGSGSSADYPREFFTPENASRLAGSLSYPNHPADIERPEYRDPLSAIASIGDTVTIEEHDGKMGFWGEYIPAKSKPQIAEYLNEYATKLALSVYSDSDGHTDPSTGKYVAESLAPNDPYRSVDLVVAAGRGGKFDRQVAESLRRITETSATAGEEEVTHMEIKELAESLDKKFDGLTKIVESLVTTLEGKAKADLQVQADEAAVKKTVESRLGDYDKAVGLISEAKLTESQSASLRALALAGVDIAPHIEQAKKVLAEAQAMASDEGSGHKIAENHLGGNDKSGGWDPSVPGFGKVKQHG